MVSTNSISPLPILYNITDTAPFFSDSPENALKEINFFFPNFNVDQWRLDVLEKFASKSYVYDLKNFIHKPV